MGEQDTSVPNNFAITQAQPANETDKVREGNRIRTLKVEHGHEFDDKHRRVGVIKHQSYASEHSKKSLGQQEMSGSARIMHQTLKSAKEAIALEHHRMKSLIEQEALDARTAKRMMEKANAELRSKTKTDFQLTKDTQVSGVSEKQAALSSKRSQLQSQYDLGKASVVHSLKEEAAAAPVGGGVALGIAQTGSVGGLQAVKTTIDKHVASMAHDKSVIQTGLEQQQKAAQATHALREAATKDAEKVQHAMHMKTKEHHEVSLQVEKNRQKAAEQDHATEQAQKNRAGAPQEQQPGHNGDAATAPDQQDPATPEDQPTAAPTQANRAERTSHHQKIQNRLTHELQRVLHDLQQTSEYILTDPSTTKNTSGKRTIYTQPDFNAHASAVHATAPGALPTESQPDVAPSEGEKPPSEHEKISVDTYTINKLQSSLHHATTLMNRLAEHVAAGNSLASASTSAGSLDTLLNAFVEIVQSAQTSLQKIEKRYTDTGKAVPSRAPDREEHHRALSTDEAKRTAEHLSSDESRMRKTQGPPPPEAVIQLLF